MVGFNVPVGTV